MNSHIKKMEEARREEAKILAQQSVPEKVTGLIGSEPSAWVNANGTNYEWAIPETTVSRLSGSLSKQLKAFGCTMFDVEGTADPYYWVSVRYVQK
jgi:hypothetical protein